VIRFAGFSIMVKQVYRKIKYSLFTSAEKEYIDFHIKRQPIIISEYLRNHEVKKLQIGAQSNSIRGWLNVDILPKTHQVAYMDATKPFPIADDTFDYVFSEHMIEHVTLEEGSFMLQECYRILKPGGRIRIATPDIELILKIMTQPEHETHRRYIEFYRTKFLGPGPFDPVYAVNALFYLFGHRFLHAESTLRFILEKTGFKSVTRFGVGESNDAALTNIEQHANEVGKENNDFETLVVQAEK
jgi:SAM-dependent methyltransferase